MVEMMKTVTGGIDRGGVTDLQDLLDSVPADRTVLCFSALDSLIFHDGEKELGRIPLDGVVDVSLLDDSSVQKRYTIGRFLLLGPLVLLFPKKVIHEAFRICVQWEDSEGSHHVTYIRVARRVMADQMLKSIKGSLSPDAAKPAAMAPKTTKPAVSEEEQSRRFIETSPFITCGYCTVEFRRTDLPPDGKCPVCGRPFSVDAK
jgi:hypothetical protein